MYRERKKHPPVSLYESYLQNKVFEHLRFSAVNFCILTCPGETSGGTPSNTLAVPISKSTTQIAGSLLLVRASPQSSQYKLLSWLGIGTHVPPKKQNKSPALKHSAVRLAKQHEHMFASYLSPRMSPILRFGWCVLASLRYVQQFVLTRWPRQAAKLGWK